MRRATLLPEYRLSPEYPSHRSEDPTTPTHGYKQGNNPADIIVAGTAEETRAFAPPLSFRQGNSLPPRRFCFPWTDLACEGQAFARKHPDPIHTKETFQPWPCSTHGRATSKSVSPIHGEFSLSPLYIQCGSKEILLDDSRALRRERARSHTDASISRTACGTSSRRSTASLPEPTSR